MRPVVFHLLPARGVQVVLHRLLAEGFLSILDSASVTVASRSVLGISGSSAAW